MNEDRLRYEIVELSVMRNKVVHADTEMSDTDAQRYIEKVEHIITKMDEFKEELQKEIKPRSKDAKNNRAS